LINEVVLNRQVDPFRQAASMKETGITKKLRRDIHVRKRGRFSYLNYYDRVSASGTQSGQINRLVL
jgi:hypothetical protein